MSAKLKEYVKTDTFKTFFEMFLEFRYTVDTKKMKKKRKQLLKQK